MEYMLSVALFAISSSVTPGPNNLLVMTSGLNFGVRKSLPLLIGICAGFTTMLFLVGEGFSGLFELFPMLSLAMKTVGTAYLLYLAWLIARNDGIGNISRQTKPMGVIKGALFQWVNVKAWVVAIGAISVFTTVGENHAYQNIVIATIFFIVSFPCVGVWLVLGSHMREHLKSTTYLRWFNISMSFLLVLSVAPVFKDIWQQFQY
ncbi:LysE family translocator [Vibrio profundum]|uniref:LysE family translocator n=1 Tax=Vibrio profundum TaxID=2910247 RepID=UPI003D0A8D18